MKDEIYHFLDKTPKRVRTKVLRDKAKSYKKELSNWSFVQVLEVCESLLNRRSWSATIFAYQIVFDQRKKYTPDTFTIFDKWTKSFVRDWWDCDDFMTHAVAYLLQQFPTLIPHTREWMTSHEFAVRRSAAVCLIPLVRKHQIPFEMVEHVCNTLLQDDHYLVQKGYGWLLKESAKHYYDDVITYLEKNVKNMPRTAFRYALEKLPKNEKERLMAL